MAEGLTQRDVEVKAESKDRYMAEEAQRWFLRRTALAVFVYFEQ